MIKELLLSGIQMNSVFEYLTDRLESFAKESFSDALQALPNENDRDEYFASLGKALNVWLKSDYGQQGAIVLEQNTLDPFGAKVVSTVEINWLESLLGHQSMTTVLEQIDGEFIAQALSESNLEQDLFRYPLNNKKWASLHQLCVSKLGDGPDTLNLITNIQDKPAQYICDFVDRYAKGFEREMLDRYAAQLGALQTTEYYYITNLNEIFSPAACAAVESIFGRKIALLGDTEENDELIDFTPLGKAYLHGNKDLVEGMLDHLDRQGHESKDTVHVIINSDAFTLGQLEAAIAGKLPSYPRIYTSYCVKKNAELAQDVVRDLKSELKSSPSARP